MIYGQTEHHSYPNDQWLEAQVKCQEYGSKSEVVNDLIRQVRRRQESTQSLRNAFIAGENSDICDDQVSDIQKRALARRKHNG